MVANMLKVLYSIFFTLFLLLPVKSAEFTIQEIKDENWAVIFLTGSIKPKDYEKYLNIVETSKKPIRQIWLNSPGGSLRDGYLIGRHVNENDIITIVPPRTFNNFTQCNSACAIISLSGKKKVMATNSIIGLHSTFEEKGNKRVISKDAMLGNALVNHYFGYLNLPIEVSLAWTGTDPSTLKIIKPEDNEKFDIGYEVVTPDFFK